MARAARLDLTIEQGATFTYNLTWRDGSGAVKALGSGWTARLQIRETVSSSTTLASLTNTAGITLGNSAPNIVISISATDTAALNFTNAVYDLELVNSGTVYRVLEGKVNLSKEVTR